MSRSIRRALVAVCTVAAPLGSPSVLAAEPGGNAFNPKISLVLDSLYAQYASDATTRGATSIPGVIAGPEAGLSTSGFSIGETELAVESNIDDQWHGWSSIAFGNEDGETVVDVEEAYVNTLALPAGLALKLGRFKSELGYQNHIHGHAWDFADLPLAYRALLGGQVQDDGAQLRWIAPTDLLLELGVEAGRGQSFPGGGEQRDGINAMTGFVHLGGDVGTDWSWRLGASGLHTNSDARETGDEAVTEFTGTSSVGVLDTVLKWAPDGNPAARNFTLNAEYLRRQEHGDLLYDAASAGTPAGPSSSTYSGTQSGWYAQGVYQFMPRWRAGLRHDALTSGNTVSNPAPGTPLATLADNSGALRDSAMVDFSNSEFSRVRLQYSRDRTAPGDGDDQFFLQFIYSLGAHPAHQF